MPDIRVGESNLTIGYSVMPGDGTRYIWIVTIISPDMATNVLRGITPNYVLVAPVSPPGRAYPFLRGVAQAWGYVREKTQLGPHDAKMLAYMLPVITRMPPADDVLAAAMEAAERVRMGGSL